MDLVEVKNRKTEIKRHSWELARFEIINFILSKQIKNDTSYSILDIGCGDIFFISSLSKLYPNVFFYAVDIAFTDEIMEKLNKEANNQNIFLFRSLDEAHTHMKKSANLILLLDVVEHIEDDLLFLKNLAAHAVVSDNTNVMITVPAYQKLFCSHDHFLGHYRRYTNTTLKNTIEISGFKKTNIGYFFFSLILPRVIQVIKEKIKKPNLTDGTTGLVEWNGGSFISNFIKGVLLIDFHVSNFIKSISGKSLPGLSNYIICKKRAL